MLKNLRIKDFVLIQNLDIDFQPGFTVLTGETGAGKSIILGAISLLLGGRADSKMINKNASKCFVEGWFDISGLNLESFFVENDIDFEGEDCVIRREIISNGKSRSFINDTPVSLSKIREISSRLIDIHSQHQNLLMGEETFLINALDLVGDYKDLLSEYREIFQKWSNLNLYLNSLLKKGENGGLDKEFLQYQLDQILEIRLIENEQEDLERELDALTHAEDIKSCIYQNISYLESEEQSPIRLLKNNAYALNTISDYFPSAVNLSERIDSVRLELEDIASELNHILDTIDFDPKRLIFVEERLSAIYSLEKKHHVDNLPDLLAIADKLSLQLNQVEKNSEEIENIKTELNILYDKMLDLGGALSTKRLEISKVIANNLTESLSSLGIKHSKLSFEIQKKEKPNIGGFDSIAMLFSANKNVELQDVTKVASGGEIARLMLSLKAIISSCCCLPTLIFDEIDTGVSGTVAAKMASLMLRISNSSQVICITHLPQIAAMGEHHYKVYKIESNEETTTHMVRLSDEERIVEIAKMLSGENLTDEAISNAKILIKQK